MSSSEYFTVYFENKTDDRNEILIPATRGVTLANALSSALSIRNLKFSDITISDNNFQSSKEISELPCNSIVDENTDVGILSGKMLIVTEKENIKRNNHSTLQKAFSVGNNSNPKLFTSMSTEEPNEITESKANKQTKQRWSTFLGIKNPQQSQLCELLNTYARTTVPKPKSTLNITQLEYSEALSYLEIVKNTTWINFVDRTTISDTETKIQSAIWELVSTEAAYISAIQTVDNLFIACLEAIQEEHLLCDVDQNKLFSNIRDICDVNIKFWALYLYPMVKHSEKTGHQMCIDYFQDGFLSFDRIFTPYTKYCAEQSTCQYYCKDLNKGNTLFTTYLAWCESRSECKRNRLADILVRPMQRITKYSLLLTAVRKHYSSDENICELMDAMIHSVEDFVCSVNSHLTTRQENERLRGIMNRIEAYDVVDSTNEHLDKMVKQYNTMFDLCEPMKGCALQQVRHLFIEGDLRFKDINSKLDVHCFLLTDMLLVCKTISKRGHGSLKIIRQPFMTDKLVINLKENVLFCVYLNELNCAVAAFSLHCSEPKVIKSWADGMTKAKHIYSRLKQVLIEDEFSLRSYGNFDNLNVKKSPISSSFGSRIPSSNNSVSGSVDLNESKNISIDYDKTNSISSEEGSSIDVIPYKKSPQSSFRKLRLNTVNTLVVQPNSNLGQSLPNLTINQNQIINNMLLVPGSSNITNANLLSPTHRGISYPPPTPSRATLQRTRAVQSAFAKNPPLQKTKHVISQCSFNWPESHSETAHRQINLEPIIYQENIKESEA